VTVAVRDGGMDLAAAQAFARHRDPRVTARYFDDSASLAARVSDMLDGLIAATPKIL
jgi:hypothetical protein